VWTYTVLAARADAAARPELLAAAGLHRAQLGALGAAAAQVCAGLPPVAPGFALPADAGSPGQLAGLEGSAAAAWSDLVGAAGPAARTAAADGLIRAARRAAATGARAGTAASAFPGHRAAQAAAEQDAARSASAPPSQSPKRTP
jgi:hypothetical protein